LTGGYPAAHPVARWRLAGSRERVREKLTDLFNGEEAAMRLFSVGRVIAVAVLFAFIGFAVAQTVPGPTSEKPFDEKWAP
jgi:hypothetical protein